MDKKGLGQYDLEYARSHCFWGTSPGKFVVLLSKHLPSGHVLDLGAGEGKNSIYLAQSGFDVVALECSYPALTNFRNQLRRVAGSIRTRIEVVQMDVRSYVPSRQFDAVVAYGLLHCLPNEEDAHNVIETMKTSTRPKGYNVIVTFTSLLDVPQVQKYLNPTFLDPSLVLEHYRDWEVLKTENEIIEEKHPTSLEQHSHSLFRLLAQRGSK